MPRVAAVVAELMLASRVRASLEASGHEVVQVADLTSEFDAVDLVVADLDLAPPERLAELSVPVVAFYQHTDIEIKARADAVGLAIVIPRSRMARELPELVDAVLGA